MDADDSPVDYTVDAWLEQETNGQISNGRMPGRAHPRCSLVGRSTGTA